MTNDRRLPRTNPPQKVHREGLHHRGNEPAGSMEAVGNDGSWALVPSPQGSGVLVFDGSGRPFVLSAGTAGQILTSNGPGAAPSWETP